MLLMMKEWNSCKTDPWTFLLCHSWKAKDALGCRAGWINVPLQDYFLSWVFCLFWSHWRTGVECTIELTLMVWIHQRQEEETVCTKLALLLSPPCDLHWFLGAFQKQSRTITSTKRINISVWNLYAQRDSIFKSHRERKVLQRFSL